MLSGLALIPLETLPGWPAVNDPTVLELLTLTLFIPLGVSAVLALLILGPGWKSQDPS
ncbi:MAG TPA: hypothetical protein PKV13_09030 [Propionicimonas sp.]|nr:hypothetical protein [Propionicimonas sp.]HRA06748.1 hypothetical protein [Propionicimonas sp.]